MQYQKTSRQSIKYHANEVSNVTRQGSSYFSKDFTLLYGRATRCGMLTCNEPSTVNRLKCEPLLQKQCFPNRNYLPEVRERCEKCHQGDYWEPHDYWLLNRYSVMLVENLLILLKNAVQLYIADSALFNVLHDARFAIDQGGRGRTLKELYSS